MTHDYMTISYKYNICRLGLPKMKYEVIDTESSSCMSKRMYCHYYDEIQPQA